MQHLLHITSISLNMAIQINRIKAILAENKKTNKWLADSLGKNIATVSRWCTNDNQPGIETFYQIAKLLDVDIRELFNKTK